MPRATILLLLTAFDIGGTTSGTCLSHALGMESGDIPDDRLQASTTFSNDYFGHGPQRARLNSVSNQDDGITGGWAADVEDDSQWIQADLGEEMTVTGIVTQGRYDADGLIRQWVTAYKVFYGSIDLAPYIATDPDDPNILIFPGNTDNNSPVMNTFDPITARFIAIQPTNWSESITMRFEILGCIDEEDNVIDDEGTLESTEDYINQLNELKRWELFEIGKNEEKRFKEPEVGVMLWTQNISDEIASIEVSDTSLQLFSSKEGGESLGVVVVVVDSSKVKAEHNLSGNSMKLISNIISVNVYDVNTNEISDIEIIVTIPTSTGGGIQTCCFLNDSLDTYYWSTNGCSTVEVSNQTANNQMTNVTCYCSHLTSFAILMRVQDVSKADDEVASILTYIGLSISTVFLMLILLTTCTLPELRRCERFIALRHLVIALLCVNACFTCLTLKPKHHVLCGAVAGSLHYSLLVAFMWMALWCTDLYFKIRHAFSDHQKRFNYLRVIGWLLPLIVVAITVGVTREQYSSTSCWLNTSIGVIWTFIIPVFITILTVTVQLIVIFYEVYKKSTALPSNCHDEHEKLKKVRSTSYRVLLLAPVVGLPWITGLLVMMDDSLFIQYIFIASTSLQGLWIWISQFCLSKEVRYAFRKYCCGNTNQISSSKSTAEVTQRADLSFRFT